MTAGNEHGASAVRALMTDFDLPPSNVDIDRAVRDARRSDRRLRVGGAAAVLLAVGATSGAVAVGIGGGHGPQQVAAADACTARITTLDAPGVSSTQLRLRGGDPSGRYLVGTSYHEKRGGYTIRGVLWKDGEARLFDVPPAGRNKNQITIASDVNGKGVVAGGDLSEAERTGVWTWRDGQVRKLPAAPGYDLYQDVRINERGDVAATASKLEGAGLTRSGQSVAVVWPADAPDQPRILRGPGWVRVTGIGDDGTVLGLAADDELVRRGEPYAWTPDGRARALTVPPGWDGAEPAGVRDGHIVGYAERNPFDEVSPLPPRTPQSPLDDYRMEVSGLPEVAPVRWPLNGDGARVGPATRGNGVTAGETGWLSLRYATGWMPGGTGPGLRLVSPDGGSLWVGKPAGSDIVPFEVAWIGADGRAVAFMGVREQTSAPGTDPRDGAEDPSERPAVWRC
jgi:hypothetical protein